jgi:hypothetical protein
MPNDYIDDSADPHSLDSDRKGKPLLEDLYNRLINPPPRNPDTSLPQQSFDPRQMDEERDTGHGDIDKDIIWESLEKPMRQQEQTGEHDPDFLKVLEDVYNENWINKELYDHYYQRHMNANKANTKYLGS